MNEDTLTTYLREACSAPLLSRIEERTLARQLVGARARKEQDLANALRTELVRRNTRLAVHVARGYLRRGVALDELISAANVGLLAAVDGFDPERGTAFSTYAVLAIRRACQRALDEARLVRLPAERSAQRRQLLRALSRGEDLPDLGLAPDVVRAILAETTSLPDDAHDLIGYDPAEEAAEADLRKQLDAAIDVLPERDASVVRMHMAGVPMNLIGERLGQIEGTRPITRERVRQILIRARLRLAEELRGMR